MSYVYMHMNLATIKSNSHMFTMQDLNAIYYKPIYMFPAHHETIILHCALELLKEPAQ